MKEGGRGHQRWPGEGGRGTKRKRPNGVAPTDNTGHLIRKVPEEEKGERPKRLQGEVGSGRRREKTRKSREGAC